MVTFDVVFDSALTIGRTLLTNPSFSKAAPRSARSRVIALMLELSPAWV